jgi:hypothetical protein
MLEPNEVRYYVQREKAYGERLVWVTVGLPAMYSKVQARKVVKRIEAMRAPDAKLRETGRVRIIRRELREDVVEVMDLTAPEPQPKPVYSNTPKRVRNFTIWRERELGRTLVSIAAEHGVTRETVRAIHRKYSRAVAYLLNPQRPLDEDQLERFAILSDVLRGYTVTFNLDNYRHPIISKED